MENVLMKYKVSLPGEEVPKNQGAQH
jgi:hypothetical protein